MTDEAPRRRRRVPPEDAPERWRLFVAVEVPEPVRAAVARACQPLRRAAGDARWVDPDRQHLTVAFLGSVPVDRLPALERTLESAAAGVAPFPLGLDGTAGTFRGSVLWAGLCPSPQLAALAERVRSGVAQLVDLPDAGRPFRAHLTLARPRVRGARLPRGLADAYAGPDVEWTVERLVLMRSHLGRGGARYAVVAAWPLRDPAAAPAH